MNSFKTLDWACPTPPNYEKQKVHFRCPKMDQTLGPAFRPGNIIEIFGEAGSAKSQFCLDLALQTTAHSANGRVLYINTGKSLSEGLILHQLTKNMMTDCSLNYEFSTYMKIASSEHVVYTDCFLFGHSEEFMYTTAWNFHVLNL